MTRPDDLTDTHKQKKHKTTMKTLMFAGIGMQEILFILLIVLLFFGGKKIPELMKGLGKGVRSFKDGMNGIETDTETTGKEAPEGEKKNE